MDSMMETNGIVPDNIKLENGGSIAEYLVTAYQVAMKKDKPRKLLGFICFSKQRGFLELTNFNARLSRKALELGRSSKRDRDNYAGINREGF